MNSNIYNQLLRYLENGEKVAFVSIINKNEIYSIKKYIFTQKTLHSHNDYDFSKSFYQKVQYVLQSGTIQFVKISEYYLYLIEPYFPEAHLIVLGGGHIAVPLSQLAHLVGFSTTVIDDRPYFANHKRFPNAHNVICESFDKCFDLIDLNDSSFVVIVTRGHKHDITCLRHVLTYNTAYVGMIGSKRRVRGVIDLLLNEGYLKENLDKVNAPIGLSIGAITPEEIACSIISEVISYKRLNKEITDCKKNIKSNWPEFDRKVLTELSHNYDIPKAIITIISTNGSVPRKEGAKMLVWSDGNILGSIGGGCSESSAINIAHDVIRTGGYRIEIIDMTSSIAEDEGMVCGGSMEILIECF
ncbi:XdhC family protein [Clostridium lacusfryxellense]|uniref:XdhC family protein n=1 Tax=Clostridium lacusfryxellense TaxID=205328 RepID=UPI001C0DA21A|nr:XdhC/CoxI family protein [Clostridium lacusfryxellense]MBU3114143.1 XdhC family protein [Clostridium lacusfryxellense]